MKSKVVGRNFEKEVRDFLRSKEWFVYTKGISTPGIDVFALKEDYSLLLELKSYQTVKLNQIFNKSRELLNKISRYIRELESKTFLIGIGGVLIKERKSKEYLYLGYRLSKLSIKDYFVSFKSLEKWYEFLFFGVKQKLR